MQPADTVVNVIPPCPKTTRGEHGFIEASDKYILYFNGQTVVLRPTDGSSALFITHDSNVSAVKFSFGYKYVASVEEKGVLLIHQVLPNKLVQFKRFENVYMGAKAIDWTPDNKRLCIVGSGKNKYGRVISVEMGTDIGDISAVTANLTTVSFRPEKPYKLVTAGDEFTLKFYEGPPYKFVSSKKSHTNFITQLKHSPNGKNFVSVSADRKIILYDGASGEILKQLNQAHGGGIMGMAWIDDENFVTVSSDKTIKCWNLQLEQRGSRGISDSQQQLALIDSFVVAVSYCAITQKIYCLCLSGQIKVLDKHLTSIIQRFEGCRGKPLKVLMNSKQPIVIDSNGKILKVDPKSTNMDRYLKGMNCHNRIFNDGCLSTGSHVHILTNEDSVLSFDANNQAASMYIQIEYRCETKVGNSRIIGPHRQGFINYGRNVIEVFGVKNNKMQILHSVKSNSEPTCICTDLQNGVVFVGNGKGGVSVYKVSDHEPQITLKSQFKNTGYKVTCIYKHENLVFVGDSMGAIKVWRWNGEQAEKESDEMGSHTTMVTAILVKDAYIHTFSMDCKYSIWKLENFSRLRTLSNIHKQGILSASLIGNQIVTCGADLLIKFRDL